MTITMRREAGINSFPRLLGYLHTREKVATTPFDLVKQSSTGTGWPRILTQERDSCEYLRRPLECGFMRSLAGPQFRRRNLAQAQPQVDDEGEDVTAVKYHAKRPRVSAPRRVENLLDRRVGLEEAHDGLNAKQLLVHRLMDQTLGDIQCGRDRRQVDIAEYVYVAGACKALSEAVVERQYRVDVEQARVEEGDVDTTNEFEGARQHWGPCPTYGRISDHGR
jgi:hypothetical protein